ncbi:MAG: envelope stress response membrane protein PspC [Pseudomonadota bacterium]
MRRSRQNYRAFKKAFRAHMDQAKSDFQADWDETMNAQGSAEARRGDHGRGPHLGYESRSRFYLDKRNGKFLGVCAGIADYTGIGAIWIRLALVMMVLFGFAPVILGYFIVAFIATAKPRAHYEEQPEEQEFWRNVRTRPHTTVRDVRLRFKEMERRLRDMERHVTSGSRRLDREISALRD